MTNFKLVNNLENNFNAQDNYHVNYFIRPIYERKHKGFNLGEWLKLRKFLKELSKTSPNFGMLVEIYYFIKVLATVYSYPDSTKNQDAIIYTEKPPTGSSADYCFSIRRGSLCITYRLRDEDDWIEIIKSNDIRDSKSPAVTINFRNGESVIENVDQENMLLNIITITMDAVSDLVKYYWKNKFRGY